MYLPDRFLVLEDGTIIEGNGFGHDSECYGEIVFTTAMTGYLESITDPSYRGQILVFASSTIGNYPLIKGIMESDRAQVRAVITKDAHSILFSGDSGTQLDRFLKDNRVPGIDGVDTRLLVKKIREHGSMKAYILDSPVIPPDWPDPMSSDLVAEVSTKKPYNIARDGRRNILYIDVGTKRSLLANVSEIFSLEVVPYNTDFNDLEKDYEAIFVSNGPGDPAHPSLGNVAEFLKINSGRLPIFGVCLGHQLLALSAGGRTVKMKFGHRGTNHAVSDGKNIFITSHNHGYAVDPESLASTSLNAGQWDVNDGTVEMLYDHENCRYSLQYHPEGSPGPRDYSQFYTLMYRVVEEYYA